MTKRKRYDIGLRSSNEVGDHAAQTYSLQMWDKQIEDAYQQFAAEKKLPEPFLPENMWNEWLWGFDPTEACHIECLLNRSHLLGLLLARYRALYQVKYSTSTSTIAELLGSKNDGAHYQRLCLFDTPVNTYSLRHLRDTVQNVQLSWVDCSCASMPQIKEVVNALMHRFGVLALEAKSVVEMNDQGSIEDASNGLLAMNRICLRRFISTFMIMYRQLHFHEHAETVPRRDDAWFDCAIKSHHLTASTDDFSGIAMHWDIMMASKLNYIHDFPGMFNCVSQVAYFHNPSYKLQVQERSDIDKVSKGIAEAIHVIPPLMQLYPDIEILYEEAHINLLQPGKTYAFVIMGKKVYLLTPNREIYHHRNVTILLELYLEMKALD
jgi:hypothetical protein